MNCLSALRGVCAFLSVGKVCHCAPPIAQQLRCAELSQGHCADTIAQTPSSKLAWLLITGTSIARVPYRLGFSPQPQKNILVSHSRSNPAPWKHLIYTNPAQRFLPDRLQNTPKIPDFQSRTPNVNRYFSCAQSPRRAKNDIFVR